MFGRRKSAERAAMLAAMTPEQRAAHNATIKARGEEAMAASHASAQRFKQGQQSLLDYYKAQESAKHQSAFVDAYHQSEAKKAANDKKAEENFLRNFASRQAAIERMRESQTPLAEVRREWKRAQAMNPNYDGGKRRTRKTRKNRTKKNRRH
jgi:hypothetical protein